ncbi:MAG: hypothetical protein K8F36_02775 [Melioribacteraceae bacterium]|nr:hypothetical protein [Melioribacteraceae bacterium]
MKNLFLYIVFVIFFPGKFVFPSNAKILLVNPSRTQSVLEKLNKPYNSYFEEWKKLLFRNGYEFDIVNDDEIDNELDERYSLLIAFDVLCVDYAAYDEIKYFFEIGGNLLINGEFGIMDRYGTQFENNLFGSILGFEYYKNDFRPGMNYLLSLKAKQPVTSGLEFGYVTNFNDNFIPLTIHSGKNDIENFGYWQTNLEIFQGYNPFSKYPGIIKGKINNGKFYWFGFQSFDPLNSSNNIKNLERLYLNALKDLLSEPVVTISPWPDAKNSAVALQLNNFEDELVTYFKKNKIDFDLVVTPFSESKLKLNSYKNLTLDMSEKFLSSDNFKTTITSYNNYFESSFGEKLSTVFLNTTLLSPGNVKALADEGFDALYCECKSLLNENYYSLVEGSLILTPLKIDAALTVKEFSLEDCNEFIHFTKNLFAKIDEEGLYFNLSIPRSAFKNCDYKTEILRAISYFNQNNSWITSSKEIFGRLNDHRNLHVSVDKLNSSKYSFAIKNSGEKSMDDVTIVSNEILNFYSITDNRLIKRDFIDTSGKRIIVVKSIKRGESIELVFENSGNY